MWLDTCLTVLSYRYEPYGIDYVANVRTGRLRKYHPDFEVSYIDGTKCLVEIKPKKKMTVAKNVKKFAAAVVFCQKNNLTWVVVTELELKGLGLM